MESAINGETINLGTHGRTDGTARDEKSAAAAPRGGRGGARGGRASAHDGRHGIKLTRETTIRAGMALRSPLYHFYYMPSSFSYFIFAFTPRGRPPAPAAPAPRAF
ncbi:hypothetical protein EVAR_64008_1 [Eumeta japonica]|uniref:Uncharacterized protein n=1 Tax=Eumeta variegata TaxID=151549 RepID=A0A4C1YY72_EUMVA|nr:hypothetical protein EVAR_64008_1 [Eumeta japonica]